MEPVQTGKLHFLEQTTFLHACDTLLNNSESSSDLLINCLGKKPFPKIAILCGGSGVKLIAQKLIQSAGVNCAGKISLIVNGYDDAKSTGAIRKAFSMLGPADVAKNITSC